MTMTDPIADMLTRIRNANVAMHDEVRMPSSKQKEALAAILAEGGLHRGLQRRRRPRPPGQHADRHHEVLARAGPDDLRPAAGVQAGPAGVLARPRRCRGCSAASASLSVSTSQGLMTDREARKRNMGGEVLCYVW